MLTNSVYARPADAAKKYFSVSCKVTFLLEVRSPQATGNTKDVRKKKFWRAQIVESFTLVCYAFHRITELFG